jgi:hypothetical protein
LFLEPDRLCDGEDLFDIGVLHTAAGEVGDKADGVVLNPAMWEMLERGDTASSHGV